MKQSLFWLRPREVAALEYLLQKHAHASAAPLIRYALETAAMFSEKSSFGRKLSAVIALVEEDIPGGGALDVGKCPAGWRSITPRLAQEQKESLCAIRERWKLQSNQSAVRFALLAVAVRDGFEVT